MHFSLLFHNSILISLFIGKPYQVHVYENDHSVPCRSFGFHEFTKSLKDEYRSLEGKKLGDLRRSGVQIENFVYKARFIYIGDTSEGIFEMNPEIFDYKSIIVECTFLYDEDIEQAIATKHCHWKNLRWIFSDNFCSFFLTIDVFYLCPNFNVDFCIHQLIPLSCHFIYADLLQRRTQIIHLYYIISP